MAGTLLLAIDGYVTNLFGITIEPALHPALHIVIAIIPAGLWFLLARLPEARADEPRTRLATIFWLSALVANGVAIPLMTNILQLDEWLPLADPVTRLIGYTLSAGVVQELSKYIVVRTITWETRLRERNDAIAYCFAAALGYATTISIYQALTSPSTPAFATFDTFSNVALSIASSLIVAYGLGEARLGRASAFVLPASFALAALLYGTLTMFRGLLTNAELTLSGRAQISQPNPLIDVALVAGVVLVLALAIAFLIGNAERREAELRAGR
jgi:RsiW-degrading membrane proteinase PrsW (M82 family)